MFDVIESANGVMRPKALVPPVTLYPPTRLPVTVHDWEKRVAPLGVGKLRTLPVREICSPTMTVICWLVMAGPFVDIRGDGGGRTYRVDGALVDCDGVCPPDRNPDPLPWDVTVTEYEAGRGAVTKATMLVGLCGPMYQATPGGENCKD